MKNIITLVLLTFTVSLFGQMKEYKKATNLYNDKKFSEANIILEKLINKEFGELEQEMAFYVLYMNAGCYYNLNDFKIAYKKYEELIIFVKNSVNLFTTPTGKEDQIASLEKFKEDFKSKIPKDEHTSIQNNISSESNTTTNSVSNENITKANSDNKTVTLTVSGTGKTLEEARLNALRSAIEQAFGTFISSKTEILNDNLVKDKIVSVTNGNIQKYDVISQVEIPNNGYVMTLSATVSIDKLTSFAQSKGVVVEFNGGTFANNIKLQKLNEQAEHIALKNLCITSFELLLNSIDFNIEVSEPQSLFNNKEKVKMYNYKYDLKNGCYVKQFEEKDYYIDFTINVKSNNNLKLFYDNFTKTIISMSMSSSEVNNYKSTNKPIFAIRIFEKDYYLRNPECINILRGFFTKMELIPSLFEITSNVEIYNNLLVNKWLDPIHNSNTFLNFYEHYYDNYYDYFRSENYSIDAESISKIDNKFPIFNDILNFDYQVDFQKNEDYKYRKGLERFFNLKSYFEIVPKEFESKFSISRSFTIEEIEKLDKFEIKKIDLLKSLNYEQERINNVKQILLYSIPKFSLSKYIQEFNGEEYQYENYNYSPYKIEASPKGYFFELIEKTSDFYIIKSINPYDQKPGKLYKLKPSKEIIKEEY
jgi:hypothetical protein